MNQKYPLYLINKKPNFYGFSGLDRAAHIREIEDWSGKILTGVDSYIVPVWRSQSLICDSEMSSPHAVFLTAEDSTDLCKTTDGLAFLGSKEGRSYIAVDLSEKEDAWIKERFSQYGKFCDLRQIGPLLERFQGSLLAYARGLMYWHKRHKFCGVCGSPTLSFKGGHQRDCTNEACRAPVFPRTDPAVIMLVYDSDRALLGRQKAWKKGMYSTLAGFLEPGETLEEAVAREVWEETNVEVENVQYHSSQPWPFPASIMLGFHARARSIKIHRNDQEVEDAQWFSIEELTNFSTYGKSLPRIDSIARRLIEDWMSDRFS